MGLDESHPQALGSVKNIGRKWKSEVPVAEQLLHENFMAQAFERSKIRHNCTSSRIDSYAISSYNEI